MAGGRGPTEDALDGVWPLLEQAARLDLFLDHLGDERRPTPQRLTPQEVAMHLAAAQLRLVQEGADEPARAFLHALDRAVGRALAQDHHRLELSRGRFLRRVAQGAVATGLAAAGAIADDVGHHRQHPAGPQGLVAGPGRWYDVAAAAELGSGRVKACAAGGVLGFLVNDGGHLSAVSALCTHMGCRLKPAQDHAGFQCLCHGARFSLAGHVLDGPAPAALARIDLRVVAGRVYARGTVEDV